MKAFVLSSGGNLGSIQSGMALALLENGISPDLLVGTSVGAINAAVLAADPTVEGARRLKGLWHRLERRDVFPIAPLKNLRLLVRWRSFFPSEHFGAYLRGVIPYERIEDAAVPLRILATRMCDGASIVFDRGPVVDAILASTALPGLFPPHPIDEHRYLDGAVTERVPVGPAIDAGAETVHVLSVGEPCPPVIDEQLSKLRSRGICWEAEDHGCADLRAAAVRVTWIPPLCVKVGPYDFTRSAHLLEKARAQTARFLLEDSGMPCDLEALRMGHGGMAIGRWTKPRTTTSR